MGKLLWLFVGFVLLVAQLIFPAPSFLHGVRPDFLGLFVVMWAIRRGPGDGVAAGIVVGAIQDAAGSFVTFHLTVLALIGGITGLLRERFINFAPSSMPLVIALHLVALRAAEAIFLLLLRIPVSSPGLSHRVTEFGFNLLAAAVLYPVVKKLDRQMDPPSLEFGSRRLLN